MSDLKTSLKFVVIIVAILCTTAVLFLVIGMFDPEYALAIADKFDVANILGAASDITVALENMDFNLNFKFEMPSFEINFKEMIKPIFDVSVVVIVVSICAVITSCFFAPMCVVTTVGFSIAGFFVSSQIVDVYSTIIANGSSTWDAASSCFVPLFVSLWLIFGASAVGTQALFFKFLSQGLIARVLMTLLSALFISAIAAALMAGIGFLILGLGWSGGVLLCLIITAIISFLLSIMAVIIAR